MSLAHLLDHNAPELSGDTAPPERLTHPQPVDPLHQHLVLHGDLIREVLVEAGLQR